MENIRFAEINDTKQKSDFTLDILKKLPQWFSDKKAVKEYAGKVRELPFWAALNEQNICTGFLAAQAHYGHTAEIYVCGVVTEYQHKGIGKKLYYLMEKHFKELGFKHIIVKTLSEKADSKEYAETRKFYKNVGFEPLITLTEMWDEKNPCLIMIKELR